MDRQRIGAFFAETKATFNFLEQDYGYRRLDEHIKYPNDGRDTVASGRYVHSLLGVEIWWYLADAMIGVSFVELQKNDVFPGSVSFLPPIHPEEPKAISLSTLAETLGGLNDPAFLLHGLEKSRQRNKRMKIIETNMHDVITGLAQATQTYALPILKGDASIFPAVMEHEMAKQKRLYPDLFDRNSKLQNETSS